jgi:hypothetical protein
MLILSVLLITGCGRDGDDAEPGDTTAPTVTAVVPLNHAGSVATNSKIAVTFSKAMDHATITGTTFTVVNTTLGGTAVAGTVSHVGQNATFAPTGLGGNFAPSTIYTATITTGAKDTAGHALATNFVWSFTTGTTTDTNAPTVNLTIPADTATGVARNTKVAVTFSEAMDPLTITGTTFTMVNTTLGGTSVAGTVTYVGLVATFTPTSDLPASTLFTATITTGATDLAGVALAINKVWTFTTGTTTDTTAPTVASTDPVHGAIGVALSKSVKATFSEAMDPLTITTITFTLKQGTTPVLGTVTYVGLVATFNPISALALDTIYTATITTGAKDLAGNALASNKVWNFTTVVDLGEGPQPVDLGTAGNFVILAKSGISTTGTTAIGGDIGVSPIMAIGLTGFSQTMDSSGEFSTSVYVTAPGKLYAPDYAVPTPAKMTAAVSDMETAYTDAAGRTLPDHTGLGGGDISNLTLAPGLYKWGTGVSIDNRGVILEGGANDVWIFQIAGGLTVANTAIVTLSGGAQAKNIFWQVAGQATLGTTSQFRGIILCQTLIEIQNGASLEGRALAQTAVTLDANAITAP